MKVVVAPNTLGFCVPKVKDGVAELDALANNGGLSVANEFVVVVVKQPSNDGEAVVVKADVVVAGAAELTLNDDVVIVG